MIQIMYDLRYPRKPGKGAAGIVSPEDLFALFSEGFRAAEKFHLPSLSRKKGKSKP